MNIKRVLCMALSAAVVILQSGICYADDANEGYATYSPKQSSVIISVENHEELLDQYGLWYAGQSTETEGVYNDGSESAMTELAAKGIRGWVQFTNGGYKYIGEDGVTVKDTFLELDGYTYGFDIEGWMTAGWWTPDGTGSVWYYFYTADNDAGYPAGAMAKNTVIDGFELDEDGIYRKADIVNATETGGAGQD